MKYGSEIWARNPSTVLMELVFNTRGPGRRERGRSERGKKLSGFVLLETARRSRLPVLPRRKFTTR